MKCAKLISGGNYVFDDVRVYVHAYMRVCVCVVLSAANTEYLLTR